jgi:arylsulfatase A-like enzyme
VGDVIDLWRERGTLDETIVVVLGDHGEMVGEHGAFGHVSSMYQPDLHVPLLLRYPRRIPAGSEIVPPVSTVGVFGTLIDLLGQQPPDGLQVTSLLPGLEGATVGIPVIAERYEEEMLSERFAPGTANGSGPLLQPQGRYRTYRNGAWKIAFWSEGEGPWLFDLANDPNEDHDLAGSRPEELARLKAELATYEKVLGLPALTDEVGVVTQRELSDAECEQLAALGYVDEACGD